jgi:hypothetical protein
MSNNKKAPVSKKRAADVAIDNVDFEKACEEMEDEQERRDDRVKRAALINVKRNVLMEEIEIILIERMWKRARNIDPDVKFDPRTLSVDIHGERFYLELISHKERD